MIKYERHVFDTDTTGQYDDFKQHLTDTEWRSFVSKEKSLHYLFDKLHKEYNEIVAERISKKDKEFKMHEWKFRSPSAWTWTNTKLGDFLKFCRDYELSSEEILSVLQSHL